jgi:hypothetical protein
MNVSRCRTSAAALSVALAWARVASAEPPIWEDRSRLVLAFADEDAVALSFETLGLSFPFAGCVYEHASTLWISPRGFVSFDGVADRGCCDPSAERLVTDPFPRIAPSWTSAAASSVAVGWFDEGGSPDSERIAITWRDRASRSLAQLQLFSSGAIVFAYPNLGSRVLPSEILIGVSPGGGASDPGSTDFATAMPLSTGALPTIYERMPAGAVFDLSDTNVVLEPEGRGGFHVADVECGRGTVGAGAGRIRDVLTVNGDGGLPVTRRVDVAADEPMTLALGDPASPRARYVLWMWIVPDFHPTELRVRGERIGCLVNPSPLNAGQPQPLRSLLGRDVPAAAIGGSSSAHGPARAPFVEVRAAGVRLPWFVLQGVIDDPGAANGLGVSVTNAVVVRRNE